MDKALARAPSVRHDCNSVGSWLSEQSFATTTEIRGKD